jgi:hypothetical protein
MVRYYTQYYNKKLTDEQAIELGRVDRLQQHIKKIKRVAKGSDAMFQAIYKVVKQPQYTDEELIRYGFKFLKRKMRENDVNKRYAKLLRLKEKRKQKNVKR